MKPLIYPEDLPEQYCGSYHDTMSFKKLCSNSKAESAYRILFNRLVNVHEWHDYAGSVGARFVLTDSQGQAIRCIPGEGLYIKIDLMAPGSHAGHGSDWVRIEEVKDQHTDFDNYFMFRTVPSVNPAEHGSAIAHFYGHEASSTFIISQKGKRISAEVHGRNEEVNVEDAGLIDRMRNRLVKVGAALGIAKIEWKHLTDGLLDFEWR